MSNSYFSHDSNARNDEKLIRLRMKHGAAGYGVFFMLLERLRDEANYTSIKDYNVIAFDLRVDASLIKDVVENFGLFAFTDDGKCFYSESFNARMSLMDATKNKRAAAGKKGAAKRWGNDAMAKPSDDNSNAIAKPSESDSNKTNKIKLNKTNKTNQVKPQQHKEATDLEALLCYLRDTPQASWDLTDNEKGFWHAYMRPVEDYYTQNIGRITPSVSTHLQHWSVLIDRATVLEAIRVMFEAGKDNWAYTESVLNNWLADGVRSHDDWVKKEAAPL